MKTWTWRPGRCRTRYVQPTSDVTDSLATVSRHCCSNVRVSASTRFCSCADTGTGPGPGPCAASQSNRCSMLTFSICYTAATGSWSSSGTGFTTAGAHVCASLVGQCHQSTHWGGRGGHPAAASKQGDQRGGGKHTWRHADCSQEQHPQSHADKAQASVSYSLNYFRVLCSLACTAQLHCDAASGTHGTAGLLMHRWTF